MKTKKELKKNVLERHISRKQFLLGAGAAVALPPLVSLMPKALAQTVTTEKKLRLCMLAQEFGMYNSHLVPSETNLSGKTKTITSFRGRTIPTLRYAELKDLADPISYVVDANLGDLKTDMNIMNGLDYMTLLGHNFGLFSGGIWGRTPLHGRSIDRIIEDSAEFRKTYKGSSPTIRNSNYWFAEGFWFDRKRDSQGKLLNGEENYVKIQRVVSDKSLFDSLFSSLVTVPTTSPETTRKKLLIDLVKPDYNSLKSNSRISSGDKFLLQQYAEGLFQIESNLTAATTTCSIPSKPAFQSPKSEWPVDLNQYWKNVSEMMILAFQCDISRIYCGHHFNNDMHHQIDDVQAHYWGSKWQRDWIQLMARHLVRGLKNTKDPFGNGESLLDNSLVIWHNEHGERGIHSHANIPIITFGSLGGNLRSGYYLDYQQIKGRYRPYENRGYPSKMMMVSILEAMGVTRTEIMQEGDGQGFGAWPDAMSWTAEKGPGDFIKDYYDVSYFNTGNGTLNPVHSSALPFFTKV